MLNRKNLKRFSVFLKNPQKKSYFKILKEFFTLLILKKEIPIYYFKHLYKKDVVNYKDYLSKNEIRKIHFNKKLHKFEHASIMNNKLASCLLLESCMLPTPKLFSFNHENYFSLNKHSTNIQTKPDLIQFFEKVFHTQNKNEIFVRPFSLKGGKGCFKLNKKNLSSQIDNEYEHLLNGSFVHNEAIEQHSEINKIYAKSINTIRIVTLLTKENTVELISAYMRFGAGGGVVDNTGAGGFSVGINLKNGTLKRIGYRELIFGGDEIIKHPDTGYIFEGFNIPFFNESCKLVIDATMYIPSICIGWDIAITPNGPSIIEINDTPHIAALDATYGGLLRNKHIKQLNNDLKTGKY